MREKTQHPFDHQKAAESKPALPFRPALNTTSSQLAGMAIAANHSRIAQLQAYHNIANGAAPIQRQAAQGGLPGQLQSGIESLSGLAMNDVRVHYNSSKPAQLQAHAYAQGTDIHIAPGQERHLPHEAWHVVQQKQGRVKPTLQLKGIAVNDDTGLEKEADVMGAKAMQAFPNSSQFGAQTPLAATNAGMSLQPVQRVVLSRVQTMDKKHGGGYRTVYYSTHQSKELFLTYRDALDFDQTFAQDPDAFDHTGRYPTNFSYYTQDAGNVASGLQGPHSLSHTSLAYRLNNTLGDLTGDDLPEVRRIVEEQIPNLAEFRRLLKLEAPVNMKEDQKLRMIADYELLLLQLAPLLKRKEAFNRALAHELIMRLMQMHPYTAYGKGRGTGKKNIKTKGEKPDHPFGKAFDKGAVNSFRNAAEYERFRLMRMLLWPENARGDGADEKYAVEEEDDDGSDSAAAAAMPAAAAAAAGSAGAAFASAAASKGSASGSGSGSKGSSKRELSPDRGRKMARASKGMRGRRASRSRSRHRESALEIVAEHGVDEDILNSVEFEMGRSPLELDGELLVVDGSAWTGYIRCVLHGLGAMAKYDDVIRRVELAGIDLKSGVQIGSEQEREIQNRIIEITGANYHVQAIDAKTIDRDTSKNEVGTLITLIVTGVHFSLLK